MRLIFILMILVLEAWQVLADPLYQSEPAEMNSNQEINLNVRSDLWTRVYDNKQTPVRLYSLKYNSYFFRRQSLQMHLFAAVDGFSSGRTDLIVGPSRTLVGSDLRDQKIGAQLIHETEVGSTAALKLAYESASDQPFQDQRDIWLETTFNYKWPHINGHQFFIEANNSKNRGVLNGQVVVLPGMIFDDVGDWNFYISPLDFRAIWEPLASQKYEVHLSPLENFVRYEQVFSERLSYEARLALVSRAYLHVDRTEDSLRVFFEESLLNNTFKFKLSESTFLEVSAGYAFNRFLYEAKQVFLPVGKRSTMPSDFIGGASWRFVF